MKALEVDQPILEAHQLLVRRGVLEPLSDDDDEVERWLSWELASLVEGHFHRIIDVSTARTAVLRQWQDRLADSGDRLRDPRSDEFRRVYWLLLDSARVGTLGIASMRLGRSDVRISSLYVRPEFRGRGIAARALDEAFHAVVAAGTDGLSLETSWCWQPAVRFYLRLGFWVRNWKHALVFVRSRQLCPYHVNFDGRTATFSVNWTDTWIPLIEGDNGGSSLGWTELAAYPALSESSDALHYRAPTTFALHLAVRGWPLLRSSDLWERRYDWSDLGMPEGLAYRIALFESIARECGYDVRTPRIPGLDYDSA
jgi:ribosomal protein S18 acetylase RimI-like enzyme